MIKNIITAAAAFGTASAFWRMECRGRVGLARIDPMVSPGEVAQHAHVIHGSSGFSESATYADLMGADCTSCAVTEDKSAYWTPAVYFKHDNGSYELVPQTGGMLAYYFLNHGPDEKIKAFPPGFRMIAGDSLRRNYSIPGADPSLPDPEKSLWGILGQTKQVDLAQRAIGYNCLNYAKNPEGSLFRHAMPNKAYLDENCANGLRLELMFPSCWNGNDLDSKNHKDHVAYSDLVINGNCPEGFPVRLPGLFYETIWETDAFKGQPGQFVISNGDVDGFGYHGDFMMGWDADHLQAAVDTCTNESGRIEDCPLFTVLDEATQNQCKLKSPLPKVLLTEQVTGIIGDSLPGGVQIQYGPGPATAANPSAPATPTTAAVVSYSPGAIASDPASVLPGEVFKEHSSDYASPTPSAASSPEPAVSIAAVETAAAAPGPAEAPAPTEAPAAPAPTDDGLPVVSTQYITNGNVVSEVIWKEAVVYVTEADDVTVTVTVQPTSTVQSVKKVRRDHGHAHFHRHVGRHGRAGR